MSVVVISGNKQFLVNKGQKIIVDRLDAIVDSEIELPVLGAFEADGSQLKTIKAKVLKHQRGEKIRVVKYRAKSNYHKQYGYRHEETVLLIGGNEFDIQKKPAKSKVEKDSVVSKDPKKVEDKVETTKTATKKTTKASETKTTKEKTTKTAKTSKK
jgi:large subunit ribosomal protein L21